LLEDLAVILNMLYIAAHLPQALTLYYLKIAPWPFSLIPHTPLALLLPFTRCMQHTLLSPRAPTLILRVLYFLLWNNGGWSIDGLLWKINKNSASHSLFLLFGIDSRMSYVMNKFSLDDGMGNSMGQIVTSLPGLSYRAKDVVVVLYLLDEDGLSRLNR